MRVHTRCFATKQVSKLLTYDWDVESLYRCKVIVMHLQMNLTAGSGISGWCKIRKYGFKYFYNSKPYLKQFLCFEPNQVKTIYLSIYLFPSSITLNHSKKFTNYFPNNISIYSAKLHSSVHQIYL